MSWRRATRLTAVVALLPSFCLVTGCNNLFGWTADENSFEVLLADGRSALRNGDYALAEEKFAAAVALRPDRAEARYYVAKAAVLAGDVDVFALVQTITAPGADGAETVFHFEVGVANSVYRVNGVVLDNLLPIYDGRATGGELTGEDVELDLAVAYALRGILRLRDTNGDGVIDAADVPPEDFNLTGTDGEYSIQGLADLPPEDINAMIRDLNDLLDSGGDLLSDGLEDTGVDVQDLDDLLGSLGGDLSAYYVNTGVPGNSGEGDNDGDGTADEECLNGVDDDFDGLVDEDSRIAGC